MINTTDQRMEEAATQKSKVNARVSRERSLQEYYEDCAFDSGVSSFTDFMQS